MKILLADDHPMFREGLGHLLQQLNVQHELLEADCARDAQRLLAAQSDIGLILLDMQMPGDDALDTLPALQRISPTVPIVVLSESDSARDIETVMGMGAAGYISKSANARTILNAVQLVLDGGSYAPRTTHRRFLQRRQEPMDALTKRQAQVLALMAEGLPNKRIARQLFVSEATIKGHVTAILSAFGVDNRVQAINQARRAGGLTFAA